MESLTLMAYGSVLEFLQQHKICVDAYRIESAQRDSQSVSATYIGTYQMLVASVGGFMRVILVQRKNHIAMLPGQPLTSSWH